MSSCLQLNIQKKTHSFLVFTFLRAHEDNQVVVEVTGSRRLENGLVTAIGSKVLQGT